MSTAHHVVAADEHFYVSTVAYRPFLPQPSLLPREKGQAGQDDLQAAVTPFPCKGFPVGQDWE
jgi:hypothetical protein